MTPSPDTRCEIRCDTEGCFESISVGRDLSEAMASDIAENREWFVVRAERRHYHHCPKHREAAP